MSYLLQEVLFFFYELSTQVCCLTSGAVGKCVFKQARERYGNNLKIWRTVN